jgi:hypothetical protein
MTTVAIDGTVVVSPKRTWLLFPTLLLPDIPIRTTIKLGVRGPLEDGQVSRRSSALCRRPGYVTMDKVRAMLHNLLAAALYDWHSHQRCIA